MADTHYLALYRKYRPQTFEDVCGRDVIVRTIKNQINSGRIGHSYLFCGTRGTGKTTIAKIFAKAVNCEHPRDGNPCGECRCCRAISDDANLNVVEMDAASNNGVEDVRAIIEQVEYSPTQGNYRVFIIDEAHMLSSAAFNALLKTLEEPPSYAVFILCTTEPNKLPLTILSRCQRYDFGRMSVDTIEERLQTVCEREGIKAQDKALRYIASAADGSMRDGLSILDQCNAFNYGNGMLTYERTLEILGAVDTIVFSDLFRAVHRGNIPQALGILDKILAQGRELMQFVTDFISYLRNVMLLKASEEIAPSLDVSSDNLQRMLEDARSSEINEVIRYINVFSSLTEQIRYSSNRKILTETAIVRLCEPSMDISRETATKMLSLENRIRALEDRLMNLQEEMSLRMVSSKENLRDAQADQEKTQVTEKKKKEELPVALSEDLKQVAQNWDRIIAQLPSDEHFMKICLQKAHPAATPEGELLIVFDDFLGGKYFTENNCEPQQKFFREFLISKLGKEISIRYKYLDNGGKFTDNYKDIRESVRTDAIMMQIEEDDEE